MAREIINNGTTAGDGTGEILFNAFEKCNNNFEELYGWTGWQSRVDTTNTQSLTAGINNLISYSGTLEENGGLTLMNSNSKITPIAFGDAVQVDFSFTAVNPTGSGHYINIFFVVNSVIYRAQTVNLLNGVGNDDNISVSFFLPVGSVFLANGGEFYLKPDVDVTIKNRYIAVSRIHKAL